MLLIVCICMNFSVWSSSVRMNWRSHFYFDFDLDSREMIWIILLLLLLLLSLWWSEKKSNKMDRREREREKKEKKMHECDEIKAHKKWDIQSGMKSNRWIKMLPIACARAPKCMDGRPLKRKINCLDVTCVFENSPKLHYDKINGKRAEINVCFFFSLCIGVSCCLFVK